MKYRGIVALISILASLLLPRISFAQSTTFNALFYQPALGRNPYLMLDGTDTLHKLQFDVGEIFSYGYRPLEMRDATGTRVRGIIDQTLVGDFVAAFGATEWMQVGVDFPLILINKFRNPLAIPVPAMSNQFDIGDVRLAGKARVLTACKKYIGLAFVPFITFPTGKSSHYVGAPSFTGGLKIALDGRIRDWVALTLNVGYMGGKKVQIRNIEFQHELLLGGGAQFNLKHGIDVTAEINTYAAFNKLLHDRDMNPTEAMVGLRWDIKQTGVSLHAGGGSCLVCGVKGARARGVFGVKYRLNTQKYRELDMIDDEVCKAKFGKGFTAQQLYDLKMNCPADPANFQAGVNDPACPKYYELRDMADLVYRCPPTPEEFNAMVHDQACNKVFDLSQNFSSGEVMNIYDLAAAEMNILCPPDPNEFNPQLNDAGCPKYYDLRDTIDDWSLINKLSGADAGAVRGGFIKTSPIYFDSGSARIKPSQIPSVDQAIQAINNAQWIRRVRVGGHADTVGSPEFNERLSLKRADAVIDYMEMHGIRSNVELIPIAYGEYRPAASNTTASGRAENRRVVFTAVGQRGFTPYRTPAPGGQAAAQPAGQGVQEYQPSSAPSSTEPPPSAKTPKRWDGI